MTTWTNERCPAVGPGGEACSLAAGHAGDHAAAPVAPEWKTELKPKKGPSRLPVALFLVVLVGLGAYYVLRPSEPSGGGGGAPAAADKWSRDRAVALFEAEGFTGSESPLADGRARWLGEDGSGSSAEVIGDDRATSVALITTDDDADLLAQFIQTWCPEARAWLADQFDAMGGDGLDARESFGSCSAHAIAIVLDDGALVTVTLTP